MNRSHPFGSVRWSASLVAAAVVAGLLTSSARADDSARIAALEAKLAALEAQQTKIDGSLAQARAVDAAIADAQTTGRFLLADGFTSGWDDGFKLGSADGNYVLHPFLLAQFRNVTNYTEAGDGGDDSNFENGFELRRFKFGLKGNLFNPDFTYEFRLSVDRSTGDVAPDNAYVQYKFADAWAIRLGQYKLNWTREETTSDTKQLAAERSLLNQVLGGTNTGYVQGIALLYGEKDLPFRGEVSFTDGDNTANTNFTDQQGSTDNEYQNFGLAVRGEYKVMGDWKAYEDFTARKTENRLFVVGGGADWAQGGDGDVYRFTADAQYETAAGLSAYTAAIYTVAEGDSFDLDLDDSIGGLVQIGYLLPNAKDWEVFGRYDIIHLDGEVGGEDNFHEITLGVNRYYYGHNAKLTIDAGYFPNGTPESAGGLGLTNDTEEQFVLRAQFQLTL